MSLGEAFVLGGRADDNGDAAFLICPLLKQVGEEELLAPEGQSDALARHHTKVCCSHAATSVMPHSRAAVALDVLHVLRRRRRSQPNVHNAMSCVSTPRKFCVFKACSPKRTRRSLPPLAPSLRSPVGASINNPHASLRRYKSAQQDLRDQFDQCGPKRSMLGHFPTI